MVKAIRVVLRDRPIGTFNLIGEYWWNADLAKLTDWDGYELVDNRNKSIQGKFNKFDAKILPEDSEGLPLLPNWRAESSLELEFRKLEAQYGSHIR